ncbi:MAG: hypothetical protein FWE28_03000 [Oscillospiraceae bacterium]|nr:hypothetical protein [Oscillospiraceae bacterium]
MTITQPPAPPGIPIMVPPREITTSSLTLQWIGVPNVNRYWVYQQNAAGIFVSLGSTTENHFRVGNLAAGATYTFRVFAECDSRGRSNHSEGRFTTWVPLAAPVMQPSENVTTSSLTLRWNNVLSASRYVVYQQNAAGTFVFLGTTVLSTTHFTVNNLAPNTYHTFRIFAECSRRERSPHAEIRVRTQPATLTVSPTAWSPGSGGGNTTISVTSNITWNAPTSNVNWLTATNVSPTNRTGNGSFRINAVANPSTSSRTGTITVTGGGLTRTISVTQAGAPANVTITWNANDGSAVAPWSRAPGTALGTLPRSYPRTDDRALIGWFTTTAQTGGTRVLPTTVVPSTSTTYHARWSNPNRHFEFWWPRGRNISFGFNATDATWLPLMRQGMTNWNYAGNRPPHMPRFNEAPSSANRVIARAFPQYHFLGRVDFALETPPGSGRVYARGPTEQQFNIRMNQHRIALEFPNQATQREVITSVFVHELGHVLGLEHPSGAHANVNSVMQPGGSPNRRTPTAFDIDSVRMLFE